MYYDHTTKVANEYDVPQRTRGQRVLRKNVGSMYICQTLRQGHKKLKHNFRKCSLYHWSPLSELLPQACIFEFSSCRRGWLCCVPSTFNSRLKNKCRQWAMLQQQQIRRQMNSYGRVPRTQILIWYYDWDHNTKATNQFNTPYKVLYILMIPKRTRGQIELV